MIMVINIFLITIALITCKNLSLALEPFWIRSIPDAIRAGLDIWKLQHEICPRRMKSQRDHEDVYYLGAENIDQAIGWEKAEELLRRYSFVGIKLEELCAEFSLAGDITTTSTTTSLDLNLQNVKEIEEAETEQPDVELLEEVEETQKGKVEEAQRRLSEEIGKTIKTEKPLEVGATPAPGSKSGTGNGALGPIGIDIGSFGEKNIESLKKAIGNETDLGIDQIIRRFEQMAKASESGSPYPSSALLPLMKRVKYDAKTAPSILDDQIVNVRVGIHIQSLSNFQLTTMVAFVLAGSETWKLWRPDAFFVNSAKSLFHRVTFLNFYIYIFPGGEIFMESRLYLKPKSQLVLCKYPHDSQTIYLRISSIASSNATVRFQWFSRKRDAIHINRRVQLPELYIVGVEKAECESRRKTGNYTCIEARFHMKRNLGYHLAQTYAPTATCVLFSWISVWLPEEFIEGRVFVALTVFLTLSAESSVAKETLPRVSYIKAIDIWFGFTAIFVFFTMLQALTVISLEHLSKKMKKIVVEKNETLSVYRATKLLLDSKRYHNWGRGLDRFFKTMYPVIMLIFLFFYVFVIIEGEEDKCLESGEKLALYRHAEF